MGYTSGVDNLLESKYLALVWLSKLKPHKVWDYRNEPCSTNRPKLWSNHNKYSFIALWQHIKIRRALCVTSISLIVPLLYSGKGSNTYHAVGGQLIPCLGAWLKVVHTPISTHLYLFLLAVKMLLVVEGRSSVPPYHHASFRLSGSLGTYSNKLWLTHRDTHSLWLIRKSWRGLLQSYTTQRHHSYSE